MQDQSLFTIGTGASLKTNPVAFNKFVSAKNNMMAKPVAPMQARHVPTQMSMNGNQKLSMNANHQFEKLGKAVNQTLDNAAYNLNTILNGQSQNPYLATSAGPMMM